MFQNLEVFRMASGMAQHASLRQAKVAENIAQADTPGYRAKDMATFSDSYVDAVGTDAMRATRSGHLHGREPVLRSNVVMLDETGLESPNGNTVSLEDEMVKAVEVKRQHDLALAIYRTSLSILRTSVGRGQ